MQRARSPEERCARGGCGVERPASLVIGDPQPARRVLARRALEREGGGRSQLSIPLMRRGPEGKRTDEDTVELIGRLAARRPDRQIAAILNKQGRLTGKELRLRSGSSYCLLRDDIGQIRFRQ